jgi:hypothetical protein
LGNGTWVGDKR